MNVITQISRACERRTALLSKVYSNVFFCISLFGLVAFSCNAFLSFSFVRALSIPCAIASIGISLYLELKFAGSRLSNFTSTASNISAFGLLMSYAAVNGVLFAPLMMAVGSTNLAIAGISTFGLLLTSVWVSRTFEIDSTDSRFISICFLTLLGLSVINMFLGLSIVEFVICVLGLVGSFGFCAYEIYQLENMNFSGDLESSSSVIALRVFASILSMFAYILRLMYLFNSRNKD